MKRLILILAAAAFFAVVIPASYAAVRVISYPVDIVDAKTGTVTVHWDDGAGGVPVYAATLWFGIAPGNYTGSIPQTSAGNLSFFPIDQGMAGGVYYFRVSATGEIMSNEYRLFIGKASGLQVSGITISPNPFSPDLGGLTISYLPDSDNNTTVKITIKAYTMDGKLIRTISNGEMKTAGTTAVSTWDGRTDMGYYAKNGRYIIQLEAHDSTGTKQYLNMAVMVK
jgi:hypothetical protein